MGDSPKYLSSFCSHQGTCLKKQSINSNLPAIFLLLAGLQKSSERVQRQRKVPNSPDAFSLQVKCTTQFLIRECLLPSICLPSRKVQAYTGPKSEPKRAGNRCHLSCILSYLINICYSLCLSSIPLQLLQIKPLNVVNTPVHLQFLITQTLKNVKSLCYYLSIYGNLERKSWKENASGQC